MGANNQVYFVCLQVNGPVTGGTYKWGEVGTYIQGAYKGMYFFCLQVNGPVTGGRWGNFSGGGS